RVLMAATILEDIKAQFRKGDAVTRLIMANVVVFIVINLISVPLYLMKSYTGYWDFIHEWFYLPSDLSKLPFRIWTIFTYMFLHAGIWHLLFNMLVLYWFGKILNDLLPNSKILPIYLWGGLVGGLVFVMAFNIFPVFETKPAILGASASVMAVVLAAATTNPKGQMRLLFIGNVELQYIALVLVILDIMTIPSTNPGGHIAHLGGALMGWFFIAQLRRGIDLAKPVNKVVGWMIFKKKGPQMQQAGRAAQPQKKRRQPRMVVYRGKGNQSSDYAGAEYGNSFIQKYKHMTAQECVDAILDKIRRSGYDSLTEDEKSFLDRTSKK
ncbi:MAG: rhomboid family intramembrane serine protease, partial [Aureispira sp.]|nr:rhomboid family intramembrane serine protease [Aureispira sp.]